MATNGKCHHNLAIAVQARKGLESRPIDNSQTETYAMFELLLDGQRIGRIYEDFDRRWRWQVTAPENLFPNDRSFPTGEAALQGFCQAIERLLRIHIRTEAAK